MQFLGNPVSDPEGVSIKLCEKERKVEVWCGTTEKIADVPVTQFDAKILWSWADQLCKDYTLEDDLA